MKDKNIMYKKCEECGREIKYEHHEGFNEAYPLDPQILMHVSLTVIVKNQDTPKDYPYSSPVKMIRRYMVVCGFDCFKKAMNKIKEEDFHG